MDAAMMAASMTPREMDRVLARELRWCKQHKQDVDLSEDYKRGFQGGLEQARYILRKAAGD